MEIELRNERFSDYPETENVVREAFWNRYSPGCYEHYLIHIMRYSRAFVPQLDFVAVFDDKIVGNIVFLKSVIQADTVVFPVQIFLSHFREMGRSWFASSARFGSVI